MSQPGTDRGQRKVISVVTATPSEWSRVRFVFSYVSTFILRGYSSLPPDLNPCDFYLWGILKSKLYANNPHSLEEVKKSIRHKIGAISENELRRVAGHVFRRCAACQITQGHHFEHGLWIRYIHHYAILTAKNAERILCTWYEWATVSAVRSRALDGSAGASY